MPEQVDSLVLLAAAGYPRMTPLPFAFRLMMSPAMTIMIERILPRSQVANGVRNSYGDPAKVTDAVVSIQKCLPMQHEPCLLNPLLHHLSHTATVWRTT